MARPVEGGGAVNPAPASALRATVPLRRLVYGGGGGVVGGGTEEHTNVMKK